MYNLILIFNKGISMKKLTKKFDEIWGAAEKKNKTADSWQRFCKIYSNKKRYITMGLYDTYTKKYVLFDTINLVGNFRYQTLKDFPPEFKEMEKMVAN